MLQTEKVSAIADMENEVATPAGGIPQATSPPQPVLGPAAKMERLIGVVLLVGVLLSTVIVAAGGIVYLWRHSKSPVHYRVFRGEPSDLRTLGGITKDVKEFSGRGIIQIGLMLLVGLQVTRIVLTGLFFAWSRDKVFVCITTIVLALLMYGLFWESAGGH